MEVLIATLTVGPATDGDIQDLSRLNFRLPHAADKPWSRVKKEQWRFFPEDVTLTESYRYRVHVFLGLAKRSHYFFEKSDSWSHWMLVCQPTVVFQCDPPGRARRWLKCSQVAGNYMETVWNCCQLQMYQTKQGPLSFPSWTKLFNGPTWGCKPYVRP